MTKRIGRCRLRSILRYKKMTQTELARLTGMTPQRINDYLSNRVLMSLQVAVNIANALDVSVVSLYEWIDVMPGE